ncbi:hypothetical protein EIP86_004252 [Pleurotus ostreatoroseus]|nr:hypothetical protein EIP86_004252 [Pleurotus ostreatoroseus]
MLSGIGDAADLKTFGIKPRVNLPDVGRHLQDHPIIDNYFVVNSNNTTDDLLRNSSLFNATLAEWMENRTGIFGNAPASNLAFLRMAHNASIFANVPDPAAGPRSGHIEIIWRDEFAADLLTQPATGHFMTVNAAVVTPTSRGSVRLASTDPFESPLINPNFFDTTFDRFAMLSAVKLVRKFLTASPWQGFVAGRVGALGDAETDEEINTALLDAVVSMWHPTSTARMAPRHVSWGVVDPQLRVKGVRGLRIVDASVFPIIPAAHTGGPVYIVAERAADIIKADWGF